MLYAEPYKFQNNTLTDGLVKFKISDKVSIREQGFIDCKVYYGRIEFITNMYVEILNEDTRRMQKVLLSKLRSISPCR